MAVTKAQLLEHALDSPALAAPPGVTYNFVNPSNLQTAFYIELVICMTVSSLVVCMRIWTKARLIRKFGREDWVCLLAYTSFCGYCAYFLYLLKGGNMGVHQWNMKLINLLKNNYHMRIGIIIYCLAILTIKLAILLSFLRIFSPGKNHSTFWIYHGLMWLDFLFYVIVIFLFIFPCQPIKKLWKPWIDGRCLKIADISMAMAGFNSALDFSLLILPQKVIWNLQMSLKRRIGVSAIFLVGLFGCYSSLSQIYYSVRLARSGDLTYNVAFYGFWSLGEMASGFLAMCLPVSPKFFQSLKEITIPSWIPVVGQSLRRSSNSISDGYLPQFELPRHSEKTPIFMPVKKESSPLSRSVGPVTGDLTPNDGPSFAELEPGNSYILRGIEISTKYE